MRRDDDVAKVRPEQCTILSWFRSTAWTVQSVYCCAQVTAQTWDCTSHTVHGFKHVLHSGIDTIACEAE